MVKTQAMSLVQGIRRMVEITDRLAIADEELTFTTARSGGPGGQHVNKVNSRVTLWFDVMASPSLSDEQKQRLASRLATRINRDGVMRVVSQRHRSQSANRNAAVERFAELVREALATAPPRRKTSVSQAAKTRRLETKKQRSQLKQQRAKPVFC